MTFLDRWQSQLPAAYAEFARLAAAAPETEAGTGLIGAAILWPVHQAIQDYDDEAIDTVRDVCGPEAKHIFKALQIWGDDPLASTRALAAQAKDNSALTEALNKLNQHFQAAGPFAEALAQALVEKQGRGDVYNIAGQIKAALVNIGGTTNIQSLTIQLNLGGEVPVKPVIPRKPFEPETVLIPAEPFTMGSDTGEPDESPAHPVTLPAYVIGKYPVTNRQYAEFLKQHKTQAAPDQWTLRQPPPGKSDHPVVGVSWTEAVAYCRWLGEQTGRLYRLPTEAEWEKAASWSAEGHKRRYPWGDTFAPDHCNSLEAGVGNTTPVGASSPQGDSPYGCADMAGNVEEWVSSLWGADPNQAAFVYPYRPDDGREEPDPSEPLFRGHRGGSFRSPAERVDSTNRGRAAPGSKIRWRGFRVALNV